MSALFGPAGQGNNFAKLKYKSSVQVPEYLSTLSLNAFEYQCGRGVKISQDSASKLGEQARKYNIKLSIHAPYYISLSSVDPEKRYNSIEYIEETAIAAKAMGAERIIVHSGSCSKMIRKQALTIAKDTLYRSVEHLREQGLDSVRICPETMGKIRQLGTLEEVIELCQVDDSFIPCVDFGHLNSRDNGWIKSQEEYKHILDAIEDKLGYERLSNMQCHFSKIEYTEAGGEVKHLTFEDQLYGPEFEPLAELIAKRKLSPVFICESDGSQAEDAQVMKQLYEKYL